MTAHDSFCAQDVPVVGFMSGGMVIDTVSEGFCNYLNSYNMVPSLLRIWTNPRIQDGSRE